MRKVLISDKNEFDRVDRGSYQRAAAIQMLANMIKASEKARDSEEVQTSRKLTKAPESAKF